MVGLISTLTKKTIKAKKDDEGSPSQSCLYLRSDNINWLLQHAADELIFQGVERIKEAEPGLECNCAVAGVNLDWDFQTKVWTTTFVDGVHVGTKKRFAAHELTGAQRSKMVEPCHITQKSEPIIASQQFITLWCQSTVDEKSGEFENEWGLAFETPKKKHRNGKV